jgi:GT2 family glycosyltransferase
MGGLYRRSAIEQAGYFSDRNLHAFEELDLGLRLTSLGWKLRRIGVKSVVHHGWQEGNWALLARRWRSRYADGGGELVREAIGKPWFAAAAASQKHLFVGLAIWLALIVSILRFDIALWLLPLTFAAIVSLVLMRFVRSGSLLDAMFAQVTWQVNALAFVRGFLSRKTDPRQPVDYVEIGIRKL